MNPSRGPVQPLCTAVNSSCGQGKKADPGSRIQKLNKAAQEFEGVLLSSWLQEIQKSSLYSSEADLGAGSETLRSLGNQAVALALAQRGGLGIARMIVHHFSMTLCPKSRSEKVP
jgi:Rod binding domain-containing protein